MNTPKTCTCSNLLAYHPGDDGTTCRHCGQAEGTHLPQYTLAHSHARPVIQRRYMWCPDPAYYIAAEARRRTRRTS